MITIKPEFSDYPQKVVDDKNHVAQHFAPSVALAMQEAIQFIAKWCQKNGVDYADLKLSFSSYYVPGEAAVAVKLCCMAADASGKAVPVTDTAYLADGAPSSECGLTVAKDLLSRLLSVKLMSAAPDGVAMLTGQTAPAGKPVQFVSGYFPEASSVQHPADAPEPDKMSKADEDLWNIQKFPSPYDQIAGGARAYLLDWCAENGVWYPGLGAVYTVVFAGVVNPALRLRIKPTGAGQIFTQREWLVTMDPDGYGAGALGEEMAVELMEKVERLNDGSGVLLKEDTEAGAGGSMIAQAQKKMTEIEDKTGLALASMGFGEFAHVDHAAAGGIVPKFITSAGIKEAAKAAITAGTVADLKANAKIPWQDFETSKTISFSAPSQDLSETVTQIDAIMQAMQSHGGDVRGMWIDVGLRLLAARDQIGGSFVDFGKWVKKSGIHQIKGLEAPAARSDAIWIAEFPDRTELIPLEVNHPRSIRAAWRKLLKAEAREQAKQLTIHDLWHTLPAAAAFVKNQTHCTHAEAEAAILACKGSAEGDPEKEAQAVVTAFDKACAKAKDAGVAVSQAVSSVAAAWQEPLPISGPEETSDEDLMDAAATYLLAIDEVDEDGDDNPAFIAACIEMVDPLDAPRAFRLLKVVLKIGASKGFDLSEVKQAVTEAMW